MKIIENILPIKYRQNKWLQNNYQENTRTALETLNDKNLFKFKRQSSLYYWYNLELFFNNATQTAHLLYILNSEGQKSIFMTIQSVTDLQNKNFREVSFMTMATRVGMDDGHSCGLWGL